MDKIALFLPSFRGGGAEKNLIILANQFIKKGFKVDFLVASADGKYINLLDSRISVYDFDKGSVFKTLPNLVKYLRGEKPPILLSTMFHANIICILAKVFSFTKTKIVVREAIDLRTNFFQNPSNKEKLVTLIVPFAYTLANGVVCVSRGVKDTFPLPGLLKRGFKVIYNPSISSTMLEDSQKDISDEAFSKYSGKKIIALGRLAPQKGFDTLLKAFASGDLREKSKLFILGEGPDRAGLEKQIKDLGLEKRAFLLGFKDNPYAYLKASDVFVLSSRWEGMPNGLIQALKLCGNVISTNCPSGPVEILQGGKLGILVEVDDVKGMANAINTALERKNFNFDSESFKVFEDAFCESSIADRYLAFFKEIWK